jgi:hypothetical protein
MGWLLRGYATRRWVAALRSLVPLIPVLGVCAWVTLSPPYSANPPIRADGYGYYAWTPAILHANFNFCEWSAYLNIEDAISAQRGNRCENKYPPGLAVLRFPVMGTVAALTNHAPASQLYIGSDEEKASQWLSVFTLLLTLGLMHLTMRRLGVTAVVADCVALAACWGTGLFHYATYDSAYTAVYSATLFAAVLYVGVRAVQRARPPNVLVTFGLALFITWIREPDAAPLLVMVAAWGVWWYRSVPPAERRRGVLRVIVPVVAAVVLVEAFQVFYNHWSAGVWSLSSYGAEPFSLGQGDELKVLISANHGLFSWYPVAFVALALALWRRPSRNWGFTALAVIGVLTVVYGSWNPWFLGGSMGARGFVDVVPLIAVAGAVAVPSLEVRGRVILFPVAVVLTLVTVELMSGYWTGFLPDEYSTYHDLLHAVVGHGSFFFG